MTIKSKLVSIIIRTKNEEKWIASCLRSVFKQTYRNFEVIIVDNESTDKTLEKAKKFDVKIISIKNFIPGKAINDGIRASKGEYIVCLSGHCIPVEKNWLKYLIKDLSKKNIAGVYGRQEPLSFTSDLDKRDLLTVFGLDKKIQKKDSFFHNANSAFKRNIWKKYPFSEIVTNIEDRVWGEQIIEGGLNIVYEPKASVYHWHGINQGLDRSRAKNIVQILEGLETFKLKKPIKDKKDFKIIAIIPVIGESKKINDEYLLSYTIKSAKKSKYISDVVVATDNKRCASIAKKFGAEVPFIRPERLSEDFVDVFDVLSYTLDILEKSNRFYDAVVLLEEIYPFRKEGIIDGIILQFLKNGNDTVLAGFIENRSIWMSNKEKENKDQKNTWHMPSKLKQNQSIIALVGLCCVTYTSTLVHGSVFSGNTGIYNVNDQLSKITVKTNEDLKLARIIERKFE